MKNVTFYAKIILIIMIVFYKVRDVNIVTNANFSFANENYVLEERNIIGKSFVSLLYKNENNDYISELYDYYTNEKIELESIIKEDKIADFNKKINELIYLKYPKYISMELEKGSTKKSILFRDTELVIYFNDYKIEPNIDEVLYLKVNYNYVKDYLDFTVSLTSEYSYESGYDYTKAKKAVALTFDDGPNGSNTIKILNYLNDFHFHATFFVLGEKCYNEDILISIKNSGNEIGSHTFSHKNISGLTDEEVIDDYNKMNTLYTKLFKEELKLIRPPYGIYKNNQLNLINAPFILWSLDPEDWRHKNSSYIIDYIVNHIQDGDVILLHDTYASTVKAVEKLLPELYSLGYQVMNVSELAALKGYDLKGNTVYYNFKK